MSNVTELIRWEELQGHLPTIIQDISTSEVLAVTRTTQETFGDLIQRWRFRPYEVDPEDFPEPILQELYLDCDLDCLLCKAKASLMSQAECRNYFRPLEVGSVPSLFARSRLVLSVAQDIERRDVLMAAFMNKEALERTLATGFVHYFSRKRQKLWKKGEESGHIQRFLGGRYDEKAHAIVLNIRQEGGAACHEGYRTCFFRRIDFDGTLAVIGDRIFDPSQVYRK